MGVHHDSGRSMPDHLVATPEKQRHIFITATRQIALRNVGMNTLWISLDDKSWHDVACGTSWDDRLNEEGFWYMTQTGRTAFVVIGIQLNRPSRG